jgi:hypothetical protein
MRGSSRSSAFRSTVTQKLTSMLRQWSFCGCFIVMSGNWSWTVHIHEHLQFDSVSLRNHPRTLYPTETTPKYQLRDAWKRHHASSIQLHAGNAVQHQLRKPTGNVFVRHILQLRKNSTGANVLMIVLQIRNSHVAQQHAAYSAYSAICIHAGKRAHDGCWFRRRWSSKSTMQSPRSKTCDRVSSRETPDRQSKHPPHFGRIATDTISFVRAFMGKQKQAVGAWKHISQSAMRRCQRWKEAGAATILTRCEVEQERRVRETARACIPTVAQS